MADASENTEPRRFPELDDPEPILLTVVEPAPPKRPHPGFWWAVLWCLGILLVTQILPSFVAGFIFASSNFSNQQSQKAPSAAEVVRSQGFADAMLPGMVFGGVASLALGLLAIRLIVGKEWPRILALRRPSGSHLALALAGLPALMLLAIGIDGVAQRALPAVFDYEGMYAMFGKWSWPMGLAVIGLLPGIAEELWFRGFFGRGLVGRHGVAAGVLLSSFLFGAMHLEPRQAACAMFLGVFLHLSYLASRSLAVPMTLHVLNNSIAISAQHVPRPGVPQHAGRGRSVVLLRRRGPFAGCRGADVLRNTLPARPRRGDGRASPGGRRFRESSRRRKGVRAACSVPQQA